MRTVMLGMMVMLCIAWAGGAWAQAVPPKEAHPPSMSRGAATPPPQQMDPEVGAATIQALQSVVALRDAQLAAANRQGVELDAQIATLKKQLEETKHSTADVPKADVPKADVPKKE